MQDIEKIEENSALHLAAYIFCEATKKAAKYSEACDCNAATQALLWRVVQNLTMKIADMRGEK
jgi:hypothetical protein